MISLCAFYAACALSALPVSRPDTPPPLQIPIARLDFLNTTDDVVAASVLVSGARAPSSLVLPELINRDRTLAYMVLNYPAAMRDSSVTSKTWVWALFNRDGKVGNFRIVRASGHAALDSLAVRTIAMMRFSPARIGRDTVGIWAPYPIHVTPYSTLASALKNRFDAQPPQRPGQGPYFTPYTVAPRLLNRDVVYHALIQYYPKDLRERKVGGITILWLYVDDQGKVRRTLIKQSSGHDQLDKAAVQVAEMMQFSPALDRTTPVNVWIQIPVVFKAQ